MLLEEGKSGIVRRLVGVVSLLLLVPVIRRVVEQRHQKPHRHFPLVGH